MPVRVVNMRRVAAHRLAVDEDVPNGVDPVGTGVGSFSNGCPYAQKLLSVRPPQGCSLEYRRNLMC